MNSKQQVKGKLNWSHGTNSHFLLDVNVVLNLYNKNTCIIKKNTRTPQPDTQTPKTQFWKKKMGTVYPQPMLRCCLWGFKTC